MNKYVVSYRTGSDELYLGVMTMNRIAELIGCYDFNECSDFHVFRSMDNGSVMQPLFYHVMGKEHCVYLTDRYGNWVDDADYESIP